MYRIKRKVGVSSFGTKSPNRPVKKPTRSENRKEIVAEWKKGKSADYTIEGNQPLDFKRFYDTYNVLSINVKHGRATG